MQLTFIWPVIRCVTCAAGVLMDRWIATRAPPLALSPFPFTPAAPGLDPVPGDAL